MNGIHGCWSALVLVILIPGCASGPAAAPEAPTPVAPRDEGADGVDPGLAAAYQAALDTALNPTPEAIDRELTAIVPENERLEWQEFDGVPHVLMVSWVSTFKYFESSVGGTYDTGGYDMWVTASPFVRELCSDAAWRGDDVDLRLAQLLGLPPGGTHVGFVEVWVAPENLFRPCPDNEITDTECGLALPEGVAPWYRQWFNALRARQYFVSRDPAQPGWPWTQLGYTYDWHDPANPVGASEFVIQQKSTVRIQALVPTSEYCSAP